MEPQKKICRIRPGYNHAVLGDIGGWEVAVVRSFQAGSFLYFDTELTEKTISSLSAKKKSDFFLNNYVFTRVRIAQRDTSPSDLSEGSADRLKAIKQIQMEWYNQIGSQEVDPTQVSSNEEDEESDSQYDDGRRKALKALAMLGVALLVFAISHCNNDDDDNKKSGYHGNWYRSGGGHSM